MAGDAVQIDAMNGNTSLAFRRSPWKHLGLLLGSLLLVGAAYISATQAPDLFHRGVGWFGVFFFALAVVAILLDLIRGGTAIVLDETGFRVDKLRLGSIPWNQVAECYVVLVHKNKFLCFRLKQPELFLPLTSTASQGMARLSKGLGFGDMSLSFVGLTPSIEQAVDFVRARGIRVRDGRTPL
jgi:hypothetical protein